MRKLSQKQIHQVVLRNNLFEPEQYMIQTIEEDISSVIMEYEWIRNSRRQIIGWAMVWKTETYTEPMNIMDFNDVNFDKEVITLAGVYLKEEYRGKNLAEPALEAVLKKYKQNPIYQKGEEISHCETYSKFPKIIQKLNLLPRRIQWVDASAMNNEFKEKYIAKV